MAAGAEYDPIPPILALADATVDFVVIGGIAGQLHGSARLTFDVDVAYERSDANLEKLASVLRSLDAHLRGAPRDVPFQLDARSLKAGGNFTFETHYGSVDILAFPAGAPPYEKLRSDAIVGDVRGRRVLYASIDHLIAMKEAAARPKDKSDAMELKALADEIRRREAEGKR